MKPAKLFYKARQKQAKKVPVAEDDLARSLAETFVMVHAYRLRNCTSQQQQLTDWRSFLRRRRLTARKVAKAEPATIKNVIRTIAELHKFQLLRSRAEGMLDVDVIDLSAFLESGTSAPSRALPALRWFVKHAGVAWSVGELIAPDRVRRAAPVRGKLLQPFRGWLPVWRRRL